MQYSIEKRLTQTEISFSYKETAKILGLSINTVRVYVSRGIIKVYRWPGVHPRVPESEIKRMLGTTSFTFAQAAKICGVPEKTIRNWAFNGTIPVIKLPVLGVRIERKTLEMMPHIIPIPKSSLLYRLELEKNTPS